MTENRGNALAYAGGTTHRPLPKADAQPYRSTHAPKTPRPTGLDWDAIRPPDQPHTPTPAARKCRGCGNTTPVDELRDGRCPVCVDELQARFHAPDDTALGRELGHLPLVDPDVADAAARLDDATDRIVHRKDHARAPAAPETERPDPVLEHFVTLLANTRNHGDPLIQQLRGVVLSALSALDLAYDPPTPIPSPTPAPAGFTVFEKTRRPRRPSPDLDDREIARRYQAGESAPALARAHGVTPKRIRAILDDLRIPRRDDRTLNSGGKPREWDDDTVNAVRRLYLDQHLSRTHVAEELHLTLKTVTTIMRRYDIPARERQCGHLDGAATLKARMNDAGVTSRQVKDWALQQGRITTIARGIPKAALVEAYLDAHPGPSTTTTTQENPAHA